MKFWKVHILDSRVETDASGETRDVQTVDTVVVRSFIELERVAKGCCLLVKGDVDVGQYIAPANQVALGLIETERSEPFSLDEMILGSPLDPEQHFRPAPRERRIPSPDTMGLVPSYQKDG